MDWTGPKYIFSSPKRDKNNVLYVNLELCQFILTDFIIQIGVESILKHFKVPLFIKPKFRTIAKLSG